MITDLDAAMSSGDDLATNSHDRLTILAQQHGDSWADQPEARAVFADVAGWISALARPGFDALVLGVLAAIPPSAEREIAALVAALPAEHQRDARLMNLLRDQSANSTRGLGWIASADGIAWMANWQDMMTDLLGDQNLSLVGMRVGAVWVLLHQLLKAQRFHLPTRPAQA